MNTLKVSISPESKRKLDFLMFGIMGNADKALCRAINRTIDGVKTDITNEITKQINLRKTEIQKSTRKKSERTFHVERATYSKPTGTISTRGANIPLIWYSNVRGKSKKALKAKTIKVQVLKSKPQVILRNVFVPRLRSGHRGLFQSMQGTKRKMRQLYGPKVPGHLLRPKVYDEVQKKANVRIDNNLSHEIDVVLMGI